ncbi:hypothetical protein MTO96_011864 [Rhipicephalus appendiculatus]
MQAPSSVSLKPSLFQTERVGLSAMLPSESGCRKIRTTISNSADDISNLCCKLSTPLSRAAHQAALRFELVDATDDGHDPAQSCLS